MAVPTKAASTDVHFVGRVEYEPAVFKPSRISPAKVKLIKVPKFIADNWRSAPDNSIVAVLTKSKEGTEELILDPPQDSENPASGISKLTARSVNSNPGLHILYSDGDSRRSADIAAVVDQTINFASDMSGSYCKLLRKRHENRDIWKARATIEEKRPEAAFNDQKTLFQYYQPVQDKDLLGHAGDDLKPLISVGPASRSKTKAKKQATLTEDELKIRLFSMFEEAGEEGLMLKQIVLACGQPQSFVKGVVNEIAEPGRRKSDKRTVLFVKDHFNPYSAPCDEQTLKKPRLM